MPPKKKIKNEEDDVVTELNPKEKQMIKERLQWREKEKTPEIPSPRPKNYLFQQLIGNANIESDLSNEDMDWEPTPAPSVNCFSKVNRCQRETTSSRVPSLSGLSLGTRNDHQFLTSKAQSVASVFTSVSRMRPLGTRNQSSKTDSVFTSISEHTISNGVSNKCIFVMILCVLSVSVIANMAFLDDIRCKLYECCREPYIEPNFHNMKTALERNVFGQHLVIDTVWNAVMVHWKNPKPRKPLVLSFHGYTGTGKNHVSRQIVENIYKNGMKSSFVHLIVSTSEYPDKSRIDEYQLKLRERILAAARKCERSLFIFDEIDKMPEQLLSSIKPFLDYYDSVLDVDFRKSMFIFLSNQGGAAIANIAKDHHLIEKRNREELILKNFEGPVMKEAFNKEGGFRMSELISSQLIDHFVPFLPLERRHVVLCTEDYLKARGRSDLAEDAEVVNKIVDSLEYFPKGTPVFSSSGCKRIAQKAELEINKRKLPQNFLQDDDL